MSELSAQEELTAVRSAIAAVLTGGQSYRLPDGTLVERAKLGELRARESELVNRIAAESGDTGYVRVGFGRPA